MAEKVEKKDLSKHIAETHQHTGNHNPGEYYHPAIGFIDTTTCTAEQAEAFAKVSDVLEKKPEPKQKAADKK